MEASHSPQCLNDLNCDISTNGWEAHEDSQGVIYFVNERLQITSREHPYLKEILHELDVKHNGVKYAAYRTALKLRTLQSLTGMRWICPAAIQPVIAALSTNDGAADMLSYSETQSLIQSILDRSERTQQRDVSSASELVLHLMIALYDVNRIGRLPIKAICNALIALCGAKLNEKYKVFFAAIKDGSEKIHREQLLYFIDDLVQITDLLQESEAFGRNVRAAVDSCFKMSDDPQGETVSEQVFYSWLIQEPQTLVWLPTLHRILATESVQHDVSCSVCGRQPMIGMRYRCLLCFKYDQCQNCFLQAQISHSHQLKHPIKEYCLPVSFKDDAKAFWSIIWNKVCWRWRQQIRPVYLPIESTARLSPYDSREARSTHADLEACHSHSTDSGLTLGSDGGETASDRQDHFVEDERTVKPKGKRLLEVLGEPCNTSSPVVGETSQDPAFLLKSTAESGQKQMAMEIERLRKENRQLQKELSNLRECCGNDTGKQKGTNESFHESHEDPLKVVTCTSPISPIVAEQENIADMELSSSHRSLSDEEHVSSHADTLAIVGAFTPVYPSPYWDSQGHNVEHNDQMDGHESKSESRPQHSKNETSSTKEFLYQTCDMSSDLHTQGSAKRMSPSETELKSNSVDMVESTMQTGLAYQSCDMSLDFAPHQKNNDQPDVSSFTQVESFQKELGNSSDMVTAIDHLVDYSMASSSLSDQTSVSESHVTSMEDLEAKTKEPCLIFSSSLNSFCSNNSRRKSSLKSELDDTTAPCVELSEIFPYNKTSTSFHIPQELTSADTEVSARRKTIEPVHMSTPLYKPSDTLTHHSTPKTALVKRPHSMGSLDSKSNDKENSVMTGGRKKLSDQSATLISSKCSPNSTALSSLPSWQRRRVLMSINSMPSVHFMSETTYDGDSKDGLSAVFEKAQHIGKMMDKEVSTSMATMEGEELEMMVEDLEKDCRVTKSTHLDVDNSFGNSVDEDSMLEAVLNIGNAMADFVQVTAQHHE